MTDEELAKKFVKENPIFRADRTNGMWMAFQDFCDILEFGAERPIDRVEIAKSIILEMREQGDEHDPRR